jgi:hypothetical protein
MKSTYYKPKKNGFLIDGRKGYIECMQLYVGEGGIELDNATVADNLMRRADAIRGTIGSLSSAEGNPMKGVEDKLYESLKTLVEIKDRLSPSEIE